MRGDAGQGSAAPGRPRPPRLSPLQTLGAQPARSARSSLSLSSPLLPARCHHTPDRPGRAVPGGRGADAREGSEPCQPRSEAATAAAPRSTRPSPRRQPRSLRLSHENNYCLGRGRGGEVKSREAKERRPVAATSLPPPPMAHAPHRPNREPQPASGTATSAA